VISAVGHEVDFTISDFVADLRAPTPSAAAELVAKSSADLIQKISQMDRLMKIGLDRKLKTLAQQMLGLSRRLVDPRKRLQDLTLRNDDLFTRLELAIRNRLTSRRQKLEPKALALRRSLELVIEKRKGRFQKLFSMLETLSPLKVVERGYAIVTKDQGVVKDASQVAPGDEIQIRIASGEITAIVQKTKKGS
jgi:exodeoxyribonuclease VII large subunit